MYRFVRVLGVAALALVTGASGDENKPPKEQPDSLTRPIWSTFPRRTAGERLVMETPT